jgi:ribonuclease HII
VPWIIGTDEAGYGPNLGPLVIAGIVLKVPELWDSESLYDHLRHCVTDQVSDRSRCIFADSKLLYKPGQGLQRLEENVLAAATNVLSEPAGNWQSFWNRMTTATESERSELPWYKDFDRDLPLAAAQSRIDELGAQLRSGLADAGVKLTAVRVRVVLTPEFNRRVARAGSKADILTDTTLRLVQSLSESLPDGLVMIHCDKHGGRNHYLPALQTVFPERLVEVRCEGRTKSEYRWGASQRRRQIQFVAKGDRLLPSALASLFAKYVRETAMLAFNAFWQHQIPSIKPTAGYPQDAKRFHAEIGPVQRKLGIPDEILWRVK